MIKQSGQKIIKVYTQTDTSKRKTMKKNSKLGDKAYTLVTKGRLHPLYLAIQYYSNNDSYSGNSYANSANSLMNQAVILQGQRNNLVEENSELFKKAGII